jgi:hypothetical protein
MFKALSQDGQNSRQGVVVEISRDAYETKNLSDSIILQGMQGNGDCDFRGKR